MYHDIHGYFKIDHWKINSFRCKVHSNLIGKHNSFKKLTTKFVIRSISNIGLALMIYLIPMSNRAYQQHIFLFPIWRRYKLCWMAALVFLSDEIVYWQDDHGVPRNVYSLKHTCFRDGDTLEVIFSFETEKHVACMIWSMPKWKVNVWTTDSSLYLRMRKRKLIRVPKTRRFTGRIQFNVN